MFANCSRRKASAFPCPPATSSWLGGPGPFSRGRPPIMRAVRGGPRAHFPQPSTGSERRAWLTTRPRPGRSAARALESGKQREARTMVRRLAATLAWNSWPVVPVNLIGDSRRSGASRRTRSVALAVIFYLAVPPAGVAAQGTTTTLAEFVPPLSFGVSRLGDTALRDLSSTSSPENAERTSFSTGEVLDPIPKTSSITFQPTYVRRTDGTYQAYVQLKPVIVVESGLPLFTRIQWPIPEVDDENGPTNAGVGDLTWLTLLLLGSSKAWGTLAIGPVLVFPTASHSEMGDGKYQAGPALGYINRAVPGWQFAFLLQQYFSYAGDSQRSSVVAAV